MRILMLTTTDPHLNLAIEEFLFRHVEEDLFLLWQNAPTVVIGKNQNAYAEIDLPLAKEQNIRIARRITGGGAVYHDLGNLNYTFISGARESGGLDFAHFCAPVIKAMEKMGVSLTLSGRNDLLLDQKKVSGNAQYTANGRTLHHGTLLFDSDLGVLRRILRTDKDKIRPRAVASARSGVTNLKPFLPEISSAWELAERIADCVVEEYGATPLAVPENAEIECLCQRNASAEWLFPQKDYLTEYTVVQKRRYDFGTVEISLQMQGETVRTARIQGDFFGNRPIEELETLLCNQPLSALANTLSSFPVSQFICGMTVEELYDLLSH
ncbi:MAG: lipoate--protein ligase [Clostridia bacterium]|nr:lipoate--protein ligase [Clostridia bacterium]